MIEIEKVFETHVTGAEILIQTLLEEGVTILFGIPGGAISPVYDLFLESTVTHYLVRHEQAAAHAADGYYRASGAMAVAITTSGPGALNLATAVATAYKDRSTLLAVTGQAPLPMIGTDSFQEVETASVFRPIVKSTALITTPKLVGYLVKKMIKIGTASPPGPVHLDFPRDIQTEKTTWLPHFDWDTFSSPPVLPLEGIYSLMRVLVHSRLPVILIGGGVIRSQVCSEVYELCHLLSCPVVTTLMGKSGFPEYDPLFIGMIGSNGSQYANEIVHEADFVLALGARFTDRTVWNLTAFAPKAKIMSINVEGKTGTPLENLSILQCDLKEVMPLLLNLLRNEEIKNDWGEMIAEPTDTDTDFEGPPFHPAAVLKILRSQFPKKSIFVTDTGQHQLFAANYLPVSQPSTFITSGGLGCMGFGLPASLGAKVARPGQAVVNITGDGSFLMSCQELATSVKYDIPVTICIFNNGYLGMIRQSQLSCFNRLSNVDLSPSPNYAQLAKAFGAEGVTIERLHDLQGVEPDPGKTVVVDIPIDALVPVPSHSYSWARR